MPIIVKPFADFHIPAVREFNQRLAAGGNPFCFPESPIPHWLPRREPIPLYQEYFVALEGDAVRGAYILKPQAFAFDGKITMIAGYRLPISEGAIDSHYTIVGLQMLRDALRRQPFLFALGMGGYNYPLVRMLKNMQWRMVASPFYFKVNHPFRFLRQIVFLRRTRFRQMVLDTLAVSGLGWMVIKSLQSLKGLIQGAAANLAGEEVASFSAWADAIWQRAKDEHAMIAVRDAAILNTLYPSSDARFRRIDGSVARFRPIKVRREGEVIGWAVVLKTQMKAHKYFGGMRVGSVVDCLAMPGEEHNVVAIATRYLEHHGVDLIVTNQLHRAWCKAFAASGYLRGPSNFIFAVCPQLAAKLHPFELNVWRVHMTRGDGDGPINL